MRSISNTYDWGNCETTVFWGEIAPTDHVVEIYESDETFMSLLEGFVIAGISADECVIVVATPVHLEALEVRLKKVGLNINSLKDNDQFVPLNVEKTLETFMVNGWPNETFFIQLISDLIKRADSKKRNVRAFGEMVALLWSQGLTGATVQLENLWDRFSKSEDFCLFCAYPKSGLTRDINSSIKSLCNTINNKIISGERSSKTELFYNEISSELND